MTTDNLTYYTSCLRIERTDGYVLCITELDKDLYINDNLLDSGFSSNVRRYLSAAGYIPTNMEQTSDNAVNNADVEGVLSAVGVQREDIIGGRYDFAKLHMFIWDWKNNALVKKLGSGHWGEVTLKNGSYVAEFRSLSQQIQQTIGRTYNPECDEQLGGPRCTIALGLYPYKGEANNSTSKINVIDDTFHMEDDYWNGMTLTWSTGLNATLSSPVSDYIKAEKKIILSSEMTNYIYRGDQYTVTKNEITNNTVTEVGDTNNIKDNARTEIDHFFDNASITFTSGNNQNTYTISQYINKNFSLNSDALDLFVIGDSYTISKTFTGTVTSITDGSSPDPYIFQDSARTEPDNYFDGLTLTFDSTANGNDGLTISINSYTNSSGEFNANNIDLSGDIAVGDTYSITKQYTGSITSLSLKNKFKDSTLTALDNYYNNMTVTINSESIKILNYANKIITLQSNTTNDISINDNYNIDYIRTSATTSGVSKLYIEDLTITGATDYSGMYLEFDSGLNEGHFKQISSVSNGLITLDSAMPDIIKKLDKYTIINMSGTTYMSIGTVTSVTNNREFTAKITETGTYGDDYFNYGKLIFKSGSNDEIHMEVKAFTEDLVDTDNQYFKLFLPMPFDIQVGDDFQVFAGCDKRLTTCKNKFNNHINFQGFPYIPSQDQVTKFGGQ